MMEFLSVEICLLLVGPGLPAPGVWVGQDACLYRGCSPLAWLAWLLPSHHRPGRLQLGGLRLPLRLPPCSPCSPAPPPTGERTTVVVGEDTSVGVSERTDAVGVSERTAARAGERTSVGVKSVQVGDGGAAAFGAMLRHLERQEGRQGGAAQG